MRQGFRTAFTATLIGAATFLLVPAAGSPALRRPGPVEVDCGDWQAEYRRVVAPFLRGAIGSGRRLWLVLPDRYDENAIGIVLKLQPAACPLPERSIYPSGKNPAWGGLGHGWEYVPELPYVKYERAPGEPPWMPDGVP